MQGLEQERQAEEPGDREHGHVQQHHERVARRADREEHDDRAERRLQREHDGHGDRRGAARLVLRIDGLGHFGLRQRADALQRVERLLLAYEQRHRERQAVGIGLRDKLRAEKILQDKLFAKQGEGKVAIEWNHTLDEVLEEADGQVDAEPRPPADPVHCEPSEHRERVGRQQNRVGADVRVGLHHRRPPDHGGQRAIDGKAVLNVEDEERKDIEVERVQYPPQEGGEERAPLRARGATERPVRD